jgi:hypothetical protein
LAEGQPLANLALPPLALEFRKSRTAGLLLEWGGLPVAALLGLISAFIYVSGSSDLRPIFDDSYISLTYARNLAEHGRLSFDGQTWSTGATSPLHVVLLAIPIKLGFSPFVASVGVGVLSHAALAVGVYLAAWSIFRSRLAGILAAFAIAFTSYAALDAGNGLETSLFMALLAFTLASYFLGNSTAWRATTGALIALLVLTRPEGAFMLPAVVIYRWLERTPDETLEQYLRDAVLLAGPGTLAIGVLSLYSLVVSGSLGGTASAKLRFFQEDEQPLRVKIGIASGELGAVVGPLITLFGLAAIAANRRETVLFALFWVPVLIAYVILFPGAFSHYFGRYQHPMFPFIAVLAGGAAAQLLFLAWRRDLVVKALVIAAMVVVIFPIFEQYRYWRTVYVQASLETQRDLEAMARDLNRIVGPNETLATHDIGAVGFFADYQIIDTVGLVNESVTPFHENRTFPLYFDGVRPDYLLTFPDWDVYYFHLDPDNRPDRFELVKVYEGGPIRYLPYKLYRVRHP